MEFAANSINNIDDLDEWLAAVQAETSAQQQQPDAELPAWLEEALQDPHFDAIGSTSRSESVHHQQESKGEEPSDAAERIRRKNRLAQQRSRKRRNDRIAELEAQVSQLRGLLTLERQRNRDQAQPSVAQLRIQDAEQLQLPPSPDRAGRNSNSESALVAKQLEGSATMTSLLVSLADGSWDDRFFRLLGKHFGMSAAPHRHGHGSKLSVFQNRQAAISWLISFTADSNNFARAATARQVGAPSVVVMPELVLYKVCRFYFRLLLPFSTSYGSGMVNLNAAKVMKEPEAIFDQRGQQTRPTLGQDGYLPEIIMPTHMQRMVGAHPIEIAVIPFAALRDRLLLTVLTMNGKPSFGVDTPSNTVTPDPAKVHQFTYDGKPSSGKPFSTDVQADHSDKQSASHQDPLCPAARKWLDSFMVDFVASLRIWNASDDCFNSTAFELRPEFVAKYKLMLDADIVKTSNFWRRSRGEPRLPPG
ncbi:hypothetical protein EX895_002617 [Sporisorium graminicola]|uniref:PH domain-containing protein n=1 Tax=Sporisorium graminicola TaxID=280036 RepID=A0A4U7KYW9_9BASI|nr:hypothetical protein EX895_002617 [Sporisorium graminicola]TKY88628.1 hypothetical protein EX895_002617 [Sporisorium graminicola]